MVFLRTSAKAQTQRSITTNHLIAEVRLSSLVLKSPDMVAIVCTVTNLFVSCYLYLGMNEWCREVIGIAVCLTDFHGSLILASIIGGALGYLDYHALWIDFKHFQSWICFGSFLRPGAESLKSIRCWNPFKCFVEPSYPSF